MSGVSLVKGSKVNLTKGSADAGNTLRKLTIGLGWDASPAATSSADFDLDASAFAVDASGKVLSNEYFVFWGTEKINGLLQSPEGAIVHTGDNLTGAGDGDDEQIIVDVTLVPANVEKIIFAVTIYEAEQKKQNFGQVDNSFIRATDDAGNELAKYELDMDFSRESTVIFGELVKRGTDWIFSANSAGYPGGFAALCQQYGVTLK